MRPLGNCLVCPCLKMALAEPAIRLTVFVLLAALSLGNVGNMKVSVLDNFLLKEVNKK